MAGSLRRERVLGSAGQGAHPRRDTTQQTGSEPSRRVPRPEEQLDRHTSHAGGRSSITKLLPRPPGARCTHAYNIKRPTRRHALVRARRAQGRHKQQSTQGSSTNQSSPVRGWGGWGEQRERATVATASPATTRTPPRNIDHDKDTNKSRGPRHRAASRTSSTPALPLSAAGTEPGNTTITLTV